MQQIQNDWNALKNNNELEIIYRYAKAAKLSTISLASKWLLWYYIRVNKYCIFYIIIIFLFTGGLLLL